MEGRSEGRWGRLSAVGLGAVLGAAMLLATGNAFVFADRAIAAAGENPPPAVSIRLGRLVDLQRTARAFLGLGLMGLAAATACYVAPSRGATTRRTAAGLLTAVLIGLGLGGAVGALGHTAFGVRQVGDQDLATASLIHGAVWGAMGLAAGGSAGLRRPDRSGRRRAVGMGLLAGLAWGVLYPPLLAILAPWVYVERLIPEVRTAAMAWSLIGMVAVGLAATGDDRHPESGDDGIAA